MSNYNWCHGPNCHENRTQDRIRGVKGNKVLRTRKIAINNWNQNNHWQWFCSQGCWNQFFNKYADQCRQIAPCNEPKETPIEVQVVNVRATKNPIQKSKCIAKTTPKNIIAKCNAK